LFSFYNYIFNYNVNADGHIDFKQFLFMQGYLNSNVVLMHIDVVGMVIRPLPATVDILYYENLSSEKLLGINCAITLEGYVDACPKSDVISFSQKRFCALGLGLGIG